MASCTEISIPEMESSSSWNQITVPIQIIAKDCINGTLMPKRKFTSPAKTNYTEVNRIFQEEGHRYKLDDDIKKIPYDTDIIIYPKTKVNMVLKILVHCVYNIN